MKPLNELKMQLESRSVNEGYARTAVSAFISQLDPTIEGAERYKDLRQRGGDELYSPRLQKFVRKNIHRRQNFRRR